MKRVVAIGDMHCGFNGGLTPPEWWYPMDTGTHFDFFAHQQRIMWNWYKDTLESLMPIDILLVNGDCIDGRGERSGGTELITTDRMVQCAMATRCILEAKGRKIVMTYGTPYHCGQLEDWETIIAKDVRAEKIGGHEWVTAEGEGVTFDLKHKIGTSNAPAGRMTASAQQSLWNDLWHLRKAQPMAQVVLRSHAHYFVHCGDYRKLSMVLPALCGFGSKFGVRECSGTVDMGLISFDCEDGRFDWTQHIIPPYLVAPKALEL